jgi:ribonuclease HII
MGTPIALACARENAFEAILSSALAAIVAKVARDRMMRHLAAPYPQSPLRRMSFKPLRKG